MKKLSIIVPVYNVEKYLSQCMESLLEQSNIDYEIIVVNDGSTDKSLSILKNIHSSKMKIVDKKNGGLSDARNIGIEEACGEYITFVDSDDYIEKNCLGRLVSHMEEEQSDILIYDFCLKYANKEIHQRQEINSLKDFVLSTPNACNKIFRTSLFKENGVLFPKGLWYEDLATIPTLIKYATKIEHIEEPFYYYRQREYSIMNQKSYNPKMLEKIYAIQSLNNSLVNDYRDEVEYLSINYLLYGTTIELLKYKEYSGINKCIDAHNKMFPLWKKNKYLKKRGKLFAIYCILINSKQYFLCRLLVKCKNILKRKVINT